MAEETTSVEETSEASTPDGSQTPPPIDLDQTIKVGGEEYSATDLAEVAKNYGELQEYAQSLEAFQQATVRLMDPATDNETRKQDAKNILLASNYPQEKVEEWVKIYDQEAPVAENTPSQPEVPPTNPALEQATQKNNEEITRLRAQLLHQNMENAVSSSIEEDSDGKLLMEWVAQNRTPDEAESVKTSLSERVRAQALENLRQRRNAAGTFDDSWLGEEVQKAANKVAKDMLTVIGDTSKIGRVPETAGQTEVLHRKEPVKVPDTKGKTFGDVEAQLRDWTSDQLLRSLSDPGGDSKA